MPRRANIPTVKVVDNKVYSVMVSGTAYEYGVKARFNIKPTSTRKRGFGYQVKFDLKRPDLRRLTDLMAELAMDASDEGKESVMDSFYKDMERFPEAAGLR